MPDFEDFIIEDEYGVGYLAGAGEPHVDPNLNLLTLSCPKCGGCDMELIRVGWAYEFFDQGDWDVIPCDHEPEVGGEVVDL